GAASGAAASARGTKPLHPRGAVVPARIERTGAGGTWDVPWLDDAGDDAAVVRLSRAMGLPDSLPDVLGLAVRFTDETGRHDLLLATTGMAPVARHLLIPRMQPLATPYSSLFPYVTPRGRALIAAAPDGPPGGFTLLVAGMTSDWQPFGTLRLSDDPATSEDDPIDFDPVCNPLPGMRLAPALAALREPAYAAARRMRRPEPTGATERTGATARR
ncbi:MAG TPA: hypothetical protein VFJ98_05170, partial [Mycobacteriales bacterium]|nr:hypothetical protein [Mycobacteriales bacterium]